MSKELQQWLRQAPFKARRELAEKVKAQADRLADAIRNAAPVKTGALRNSIQVRRTRNQLKFYVTAGGDQTGKEVRAGSGVVVDYALHLEYGTSKMSAHPFFYPTARAMEGEIQAALEQAVAETILR